MKKLTTIGVAVVLVVACLLLFWRHVRISGFDRDFRRNLAGTWSAKLDNMRLTNIVMSGGSFTSHLIFIHPGRTNTYQETGTWLVEDGKMIETVNSDTNPSSVSPRAHAGRIIRSNTSEFTVQWQGSPDTWVWQKVIQ